MLMKNMKCFLLFSLFVFGALFFQLSAAADGFVTEDISDEERGSFIENIEISYLSEEPERKGIACFDVSDKEHIALGYGVTDKRTVAVYDATGEFLYGYTFRCTGMFGLYFQGDVLTVYFVRSSRTMELSSDGEVMGVYDVPNVRENRNYELRITSRRSRVVGENTYVLRSDMGFFNWMALSHSQLVLIDANGEERMLHDVNASEMTKVVTGFVLIMIFVIIVISILIVQLKKQFEIMSKQTDRQ